MKQEKIKVMLVDDHSLVRDGIRSLLEEEERIQVVGEASNGEEAIALVEDMSPHLMIVDIRMPKMNGIELVEALNKKNYNAKFLILSMHDSEEYVIQSIAAGAHGYLLKDASREEFIKAVLTIVDGGLFYSGDVSKYLLKDLGTRKGIGAHNESETQEKSGNPANLTKRELEILSMATMGKSNVEIAEELGKSRRTIEVHRFNMMKKIGSKNLAELINLSRDMGYIK